MAKGESKPRRAAKEMAAAVDEAPPALEAASTSRAGALAPHLELQRTRVVCGPDVNLHTSSSLAATQFMPAGSRMAFDVGEFVRNLRIDVLSYEGDDMTFRLRGASPAIANALRRVIIAETPTVAIEHVFVVNNTSVIADEVLSHRFGMVPLAADPRRFEYRGAEEGASERNTAVFKLRARCERGVAGAPTVNERVLSSQLEWLPGGSELPEETGCRFVRPQRPQRGPGASDGRGGEEAEGEELEGEEGAGGRPAAKGGASPPAAEAAGSDGWVRGGPGGLGPVHGDILLAKLRPGQEIEVELHAVKGVGEDHAKFSPVATSWYRLMPEVALLREVSGEDARALAEELPGIVEVDGSTGIARIAAGARSEDGSILQHARLLEKARRLSGEPRWRDALQLRKIKDDFLFTIESTGAWKPHELFQHAVQVLVSKCDKVLEGLHAYPVRSW